MGLLIAASRVLPASLVTYACTGTFLPAVILTISIFNDSKIHLAVEGAKVYKSTFCDLYVFLSLNIIQAWC